MPVEQKEVSDVEVVLTAECDGRDDETLARLRGVGMEVVNFIADEGVVEGTLPTDRVAALQKLDCVAYVRNVFTYISESGAGDAE
jgi:hypothetical protein